MHRVMPEPNPPPGPAVISAHSERQAMDWSLALVSQGIEPAIQRTADGTGWQLEIETHEFERAMQTIRQYRLENRRRRWQQPVPGTGLLFDWRGLVWVALLAIFFVLSEELSRDMRQAGRMDGTAVRAGEWWRLFTATMLHADPPHLAANLVTGLMFLGLAMAVFGPGLALLVTLLAGAGGNVAGLIFYSRTYLGLGASGMVMGALGLLAVHTLAHLRAGLSAGELVVRSFFGAVFLLVLLGFNPASDVIAHIGGFVTGALLGLVLVCLPAAALKDRWVNRIALGLTLALTLWTWWEALRPHAGR